MWRPATSSRRSLSLQDLMFVVIVVVIVIVVVVIVVVVVVVDWMLC